MKCRVYGLASLVILLSACSQPKTPEEILRQVAQTSTQQPEKAILLLKNGVIDNPESQALRLSLAQQYFEVGDYEGAEKELQRLLSTDYEINTTVPLLLKIKYLNNKFDTLLTLSEELIIEKSQLLDTPSKTNTYIYQALSHYKLNNIESAKHSLNSANEVSTNNIYNKLSEAFTETSEQRVDESLVLLEEILSESPDFLEAELLKGQLLTVSERYEDAVSLFKGIYDRFPRNNRFKLFYAGSLLKAGDIEAARPLVDTLYRSVPNNAYVNQLKAIIAYNDKDFDNAKNFGELAIEMGAYDIPVVSLVAFSAIQTGSYEQAKRYLDLILAQYPEDHPISLARIAVSNRLGYSEEDIAKLQQIDLTKVDPSVLTSTAFHMFEMGNEELTQEIIAGLDNSEQDVSPQLMAQNRLLSIAVNDRSVIDKLEAELAESPNDNSKRVLLVMAYLNFKQYEQALALSKELTVNNDQSFPYLVQGLSNLGLGQVDTAIKAFEEVLKREPNNQVALQFFSDYYFTQGEFDKTLTYAKQALNQELLNVKALDYLYRASLATDTLPDNIQYFADAHQRLPSSLEYRLIYATALFALNDFDTVKDLLLPIVISPNTPPLYYSLLADSHIALDAPVEAKRIYAQWRNSFPNMVEPYLKELAILELEDNWIAALELVNNAMRQAPTLDLLLLIKANIQVELSRFAEAKITLRKLSPRNQRSDRAKLITADIAMADRDFDSAARLLAELYQKSPLPDIAHKHANALFKDGKVKESIEVLEQHLQNSPNDITATAMLGSKLLGNDPERALNIFADLEKANPNSVFVLNNKAMSLTRLARYEEAEAYATRALQISPDNPAILDTFGLIKKAQNQLVEAESFFEIAYQSNPYNVEIALNYAETLIELNKLGLANRILRSLSSNDLTLANRIEALRERAAG